MRKAGLQAGCVLIVTYDCAQPAMHEVAHVCATGGHEIANAEIRREDQDGRRGGTVGTVRLEIGSAGDVHALARRLRVIPGVNDAVVAATG